MSANRETFDALVKAYVSGDYDAAFEFVDPEIEWIEPRQSPDAEVLHGHEGVRKSLTKFVGTWTDYRMEHREIVESGERIFAHVHMSGKGRTSGVPTEMEQFQVWTFGDGKVVRLEMFIDETEARRAAGLKVQEAS